MFLQVTTQNKLPICVLNKTTHPEHESNRLQYDNLLRRYNTTMYKRITLFVIIAMTIAACDTKDNCFQDLASHTAEPISRDTLVLFHPKTYADTCYITSLYMPKDTPVDSSFVINDKEIQLAKTGSCYQLLAVKEVIPGCN